MRDAFGLIPWVPLTQFSEPPEVILRQRRQRIEEQAPVEEQANLLALSQVMTRLRYNDPGLLALFGGRQTMIESPLIQELVQELVAEAEARAMNKAMQKAIFQLIEGRFGSVPPEMVNQIQAISDERKLSDLHLQAALCPDLEAFQQKLSS